MESWTCFPRRRFRLASHSTCSASGSARRSTADRVSSITNREIADYVQEAIKCLSVGSLRAAVVFVWVGTVRQIQSQVMRHAAKSVNKALKKYDSNARTVKRTDDLAYVKESTLLLVAQDLGIYDKGQRSTLEDALNLRNKCGHPGRYRPGPKKVSSFIEDVGGIVFT